MTDLLPFEDEELDLEAPEDDSDLEDIDFEEDEEELLEMALQHLNTFLTEYEHDDPDWADPDGKADSVF